MPSKEDSQAFPNPYADISGWWSAFLSSGWSWRWFEKPHLYFRPRLEFVPQQKFAVIDGLDRKKVYDKPFDCYLDPVTGKIQTLYVQATESICQLSVNQPNATWKRTCIRNVSPVFLRVANMPFRFVPEDRRHDTSKYTVEDWLIVAGMWIPTIICFLLGVGHPAFPHADACP